jgi:hypothetical protein
MILVSVRDSLEQLMSEIFGWSDISVFKSPRYSPSEKSQAAVKSSVAYWTHSHGMPSRAHQSSDQAPGKYADLKQTNNLKSTQAQH